MPISYYPMAVVAGNRIYTVEANYASMGDRVMRTQEINFASVETTTAAPETTTAVPGTTTAAPITTTGSACQYDRADKHTEHRQHEHGLPCSRCPGCCHCGRRLPPSCEITGGYILLRGSCSKEKGR